MCLVGALSSVSQSIMLFYSSQSCRLYLKLKINSVTKLYVLYGVQERGTEEYAVVTYGNIFFPKMHVVPVI